MGTVDDIIKEFQNEITPWIPDIIKKSPEKSKEILAACKESAFLLYFLKTVPPKVLYYEDFIKYVRFDLGSNASLTIENQIEAVSRTLHSICAQINMNYPLMIYIKEALQYKTVDFSIESKTRRKELLYKTHAPFFLFYVLKYWDSLPVPGGIIEWNCLKHGLMPLYSCLNNYYNQAQTMNMLITQQIAEQTLGLEYFAFLLEKLDDLKEIVNCSTQALLNLLCMLRFLPSAKLSKMFCSYLIENFEKEEYRKNFSDNLIEFATQILKFLWHNNVSFETYINHAISISIEPNIPAGKRKIEEAP